VKKSTLIACGTLLIATSLAHADVDCPATRVANIQVETNAVLVQLEGGNWHLVGYHSQSGTREKYAALLSAQASGFPVVLRYPDGYVCSAYEVVTSTMMVRVLAQ
jgi:hypothetical protein